MLHRLLCACWHLWRGHSIKRHLFYIITLLWKYLYSVACICIANVIIQQHFICLAVHSAPGEKLQSHMLHSSLNVADTLTLVYILTILIGNYTSAGHVVYVALRWKHTWASKTIGVILMVSMLSFASNATTLLITTDRFLCVVWSHYYNMIRGR